MKNKNLLSLLFALLFIAACSPPQEKKQESHSNKVNFIVLQLNDVYEMSPVSGGKLGGLARVQTLLNELKTENKNTITVLSGDMLSPSAIGTASYNGEKIAGRQMVEILNEMNWDYFILGNHEFDLSESDLRARLNEMKFTIVSDNVLDTNNQPFPNTITNTQFQVEGVKIGVLGITLNNYQVPFAKIADPMNSAKNAVNELKGKKSDIIIALTHQIITDDINMAAEIPEIDIIMGGHEHENFKLLRGDGFTPITKADANAKTVFVHHFCFDKSTKELDINSELVFIDESIKEDSTILKLTDKWTEIAFKSFEEMGYQPEATICISDKVLDGSEAAVRSRPTALTDLITRGFLTAYPTADASIMNGGSVRIDDKLQPGPITQYDILKISPFGGDISLVTMNGKTLIEALEIGLTNEGSGAFLQYSNLSKKGDQWTINSEIIDPSKTFKIALSSYLVEKGDKGLGILTYEKGFVKRTDSPKHEFVPVVIDQFRKEFTTN
jgi:5'-nucleotidase